MRVNENLINYFLKFNKDELHKLYAQYSTISTHQVKLLIGNRIYILSKVSVCYYICYAMHLHNQFEYEVI